MTVKGILWHSTGANNPNLKRYVQPSDTKPTADTYSKSEWLKLLGTNLNKNDMNHIKIQMGMNAWIGKLADGAVRAIQTMPWDYKPWGCASGSNGSCNDGWIQFEICEDALSDEAYFNKIYKEACQLTAYLCKLYNINPKGITTLNGVKVPNILCHQDAYKLGLGSNHGDVYHWFKKYDKDMDDVRNDVAKLLNNTTTSKTEQPKAEAKYVVRKSWGDLNSQIGAYASLDNAKTACDKAKSNYKVYEIKTSKQVYPVASTTTAKKFKVGDKVKIIKNAVWTNGSKVPDWLLSKTLYVREVNANETITVSTLKTGAITGVIKLKYLKPMSSTTAKPSTFKPYLVIITANSLNVRNGAGTQYKVNTTVKKDQVFTIIEEKDGWGKLKSGAGWIKLDDYTKKI